MSKPTQCSFRSLAAAAVASAMALPAAAQMQPPPENVVSLGASASIDVAQDWLTVVFSTSREGLDAGAVQSQLKQALDAALAEARKLAKPGQLEVRTGAFSLYPRHAPATTRSATGQGGIVGWQGSTEMVVEGRDTQAIAQLTGRIQTLSIARTGFSLSREAREKVEGDVTAMAIARFRAHAEDVARQFGFGGYTVREVNVSSNESRGYPAPMMRAQAGSAMAEAPLPVEAGKAAVTAVVNGSVQMKK
jgi:predicted secreted protein